MIIAVIEAFNTIDLLEQFEEMTSNPSANDFVSSFDQQTINMQGIDYFITK